MKLTKEQSEELNNAIAAAEESAAQLAEKFGIGRNAVYLRAKKLGVKLPNASGEGEPSEEDSPEEDSPEYGIADVLKAVGYLLTSLGNIIE
ncbi:MAG: hypothetical protein IJI37_07850 [Opitutales bacterium]|nr:hypothetical protein [Opitutales bacterium]